MGLFGKKKRAPRADERYDDAVYDDADDYVEAGEFDEFEDDYDTDEFPRPDFARLDFDDAPTDERIYGNFDHEPDAAAGP
ncbi:DUF3710 domain-containing protein, partial [Nocardia cyriacigeorgica]|nr:DUF3710 domain-containing protein [Nocardia cyriacigeorgica]